jgi:hypothetical protein
MTFEHIRFLLGLVLIALLAGGSLFAMGVNTADFFLPGLLLPKYEIEFWPHVQGFAWVILIAAALHLPFDLLSGWVVPKIAKRPVRGFLPYLVGLVVGILVHSAVLLVAAVCLLLAGQRSGAAGGYAAATVLVAGLAVVQAVFGPRKRAGIPATKEPTWGSRLVSAVWVLAGFWIGSLHPQAGFGSAAGLVTIGLVLTVWTISGMLVLWPLERRFPQVGRLSVFLSAGCLSLASRAYPPIVGEPEEWVPANPNPRPVQSLEEDRA